MLYDLNVPWSSTTNTLDLQRTISFLSELHYSVLALNHSIISALPSQITNPIPTTLPFPLPTNITLLRRCTLTISDPTHNHRLPALAAAYDILALRPTSEKAFLAACTSLDHHSIISLDLSSRFPFHFRPKHFSTALRRGVRFEICYAQALQGSGGAEKRRNFVSNVLAVVRATRGRGLIVSSEAASVLGVRAPADVANLLGVWGVTRERASEAMSVVPRSVVANEGLRRRGYRGVIDVVESGELPSAAVEEEGMGGKARQKGVVDESDKKEKRRHERQEDVVETPTISKRQAKKMRLSALNQQKTGTPAPSVLDTPPISGPGAASNLDNLITFKTALNS